MLLELRALRRRVQNSQGSLKQHFVQTESKEREEFRKATKKSKTFFILKPLYQLNKPIWQTIQSISQKLSSTIRNVQAPGTFRSRRSQHIRSRYS
ncbi:hypothetical protein AVEN_226261-1 [Araneus ventricosus]|uniref:Uncharacterized protein n=1 Tax=Araneus ventricosus TaxID=182803 RepID=A0A4Y2D8Y6_ARAVE|nr:hypothetical protein AVEN_226261-1 [Araneus ventricosus]